MLPLLQENIQFIKEQDTGSVILGLSILGGFILILIIAASVGRYRSASRDKKKSKSRNFSYRKFRKAAQSIGLQKTHINTLENLVKQYQIKDPYNLLRNSPTLDQTLQKALAYVDEMPSNDQTKEGQRSNLYRIKQIVERSQRGSSTYKSSHQVPVGNACTIHPQGSQRYPSKIIANLKDGVAVSLPKDARGNELRFPKWTKVKVFFWKSNGQGFSFISKIIGMHSLKGVNCYILQHTNTIHQEQQRRFRRKLLESSAYFYPVRVMTLGVGKDRKKRAFIEQKKGTLGTLLDISAGGCSLRSPKPLKKGELIKLEFETSRRVQVTAFGKVVNSSSQGMNSIMHIKFTKLSQANLNKINDYVYDIEE